MTLREGVTARLKASTPERWCTGGYSAHHYVAAAPQPHGVYYELELTDSGVAVGYVAMSALQSDETAAEAYPFSSPDTAFTTAQVDRLCVLPEYRGAGVKEALLRDAVRRLSRIGITRPNQDGERNRRVRVLKSAASWRLSVSKTRRQRGWRSDVGLKKVVVLPKTDEDRWTVDGDDSRDYDSDWRKLQAAASDGRAKSNPVAAFNAALNRSTPDTAPRATRQMLTAVEGVSVFDAYAERIVTTAVCQKSYAAMYATLSDAMPFRDDICRRVIAAARLERRRNHRRRRRIPHRTLARRRGDGGRISVWDIPRGIARRIRARRNRGSTRCYDSATRYETRNPRGAYVAAVRARRST